MASKPLVDRDRIDGELLLKQLEKDIFPVRSAFWYYDSDRDKWDLILATRLVSEQGPLEAYRKLGESIRRIDTPGFEMESTRVRLVKEKDPLPSLLRKAVRTGAGISGISTASSVIDRTFVEDAYIYRSD